MEQFFPDNGQDNEKLWYEQLFALSNVLTNPNE